MLPGAGVDSDAPSVDHAYVERLPRLAAPLPRNARWLLFAFARAHDPQGRILPEATTFPVPKSHVAAVATTRPDRLAWVASVHP